MWWSLFFRVQYRLLRLLDPVIRFVWRRRVALLWRVVDVRVTGRVSGRERGTLVTLLTVGGREYVGHPNGPAEWTRNLEATGSASIVAPGLPPRTVLAVRLFAGPEREAVIRATWSQQPFPGNVIYALARRRIRSVGVYFRLNPSAAGDVSS